MTLNITHVQLNEHGDVCAVKGIYTKDRKPSIWSYLGVERVL